MTEHKQFPGGLCAACLVAALIASNYNSAWAQRSRPEASSAGGQRDLRSGRTASASSNPDDQSLWIIQRHAEAINQKGFDLARRGALYSAQAEFTRSLQVIGHARDEIFGTTQHHTAIVAALTALEEVDDFQKSQAAIKETVAKHRTIALKHRDVSGLTSVTATRIYCSYAQDRLLRGCGKLPAAARALYGLGNIELAISRESGGNARLGSPKAMAMFEAALRIDPENHKAANALGILLARYGQYPLAVRFLQRSVRSHPTMEGWQCLAEAYEALGESQLAQQASSQCESMRQQKRPGQMSIQPAGINIRWVDQATFVANSPPDLSPPESKESKESAKQSESGADEQHRREQTAKANGAPTKSEAQALTPSGLDRLKSGLKSILR